ncbi:alpha/beta hydrolase [Kitasatospora sp. NPDC058201]|uniref:alpha/beta hydrolase n=1 Tax=unclassified Kitasatospora TaxID=2633591 RepID=UPI00364A1A9B
MRQQPSQQPGQGRTRQRAERRPRRIRRTVAAAGLALAAVLGAGGWAAADGQQAVTGPPPGTAAWVADTTLGLRLPDPATAAPAEVAAFFDRLPAAARESLAVRHPLVVGNLDGAPVRLRYRANEAALAEELGRELARATDPSLTPQDHTAARERAARYRTLLDGVRDGGRRFLAFDPRGRGQIAEVYGDLATARRTAVVVPGSDIDLRTFDRAGDPYGTPAGMARALHGATGGGTAVIAWAGYTTPVGVGPDAATETLAEAGAGRLGRLLDGLAVTTRPDAPATVFCHSYGSVVCGLARPGPEQASGVVVLASPGLGVDSAADLDPRVPLWAVERNDSDWIGHVPYVRFLGLGHGADPTGPEFGARPLPATGAHGHTGYFAPGTASLAAFTAVALGR